MTFDYDSATNAQTAIYRTFTVRALQDDCPSNPFEDRDCEPALAVWYDGTLTEYGDGALEPLTGLPGHWFSRHWRAICKALDLDESEHDKEARDARPDYDGSATLGDIRADLLRDALGEMKPSRYGRGSGSDYLAAVAALWALRGVEALDSSTSGYSQGDYADVLAVATPEWAARVGAPRESHASQCKAAVTLYGAWAWGGRLRMGNRFPGRGRARLMLGILWERS